MKFSDYFSNNFQTSENNNYLSLQTHYYRARYEEAKAKVLEIIEEEKGKLLDDNETYSELYYETTGYNCTVTVMQTKPGEIAIDFRITTYDFISFGRGKKVIERLYKLLDSKLSFKGIALNK